VIHLADALNERAYDDGAVGNRDARYMVAFAGQWPADAPDDEHVTWVLEAWKSIRCGAREGAISWQRSSRERSTSKTTAARPSASR
jgi:hypothetical protein